MLGKFKQLNDLRKLRSQAMQMQRELAQERVEITEGNMKVVVSGDQQVQSIEIEGEEQKKLVELLNRAIKSAQQKAATKLTQMSGGLPGLSGLMGK